MARQRRRRTTRRRTSRRRNTQQTAGLREIVNKLQKVFKPQSTEEKIKRLRAKMPKINPNTGNVLHVMRPKSGIISEPYPPTNKIAGPTNGYFSSKIPNNNYFGDMLKTQKLQARNRPQPRTGGFGYPWMLN